MDVNFVWRIRTHGNGYKRVVRLFQRLCCTQDHSQYGVGRRCYLGCLFPILATGVEGFFVLFPVFEVGRPY